MLTLHFHFLSSIYFSESRYPVSSYLTMHIMTAALLALHSKALFLQNRISTNFAHPVNVIVSLALANSAKPSNESGLSVPDVFYEEFSYHASDI